MRRNPCRNCKNAFIHKNRHLPGWECKCHCEKYKKHQEYLESKRIFKVGDRITSLEELLHQEWVMWGKTPRHIEVIKRFQLLTVLRFIELGYFYKAVKKEEE